jgi:UDP-glucose 4-epimerase
MSLSSCLVTGGAGFVGSHLVEELVRQGHPVRVLDNLSTGKEANLAAVAGQIDFHHGSITDPIALETAVQGISWVFHLAALPSVSQSVKDPLATHEISATGTLRLLDAARRAGVQRVVYAASSSAYGDTLQIPTPETAPLAPLSPYGAAKLAGEHYCTATTFTYGLETVRLRFFNIYGPRQDPRSPYAGVIPLFLQALKDKQPPTIFGDGSQTRDFVYVADAVQALILAARTPGIGGQVFNIARGERISIRQLTELLNELLGSDLPPKLAAARPGDILHSQADISAAKKILGFAPRVGLREGLQRLIAAVTMQPSVRIMT